jgi:putative sigma-54 modulation protein
MQSTYITQGGYNMGDVSVTFRHLEATAALREYAVEKASKIRNYFGEPNEITIVLSSEKHRYTAEITLKAGRITANAKEETEDLYSAVDIAVDKVDRQIKKHKDKIKHHKQGSMPQEITSRYNILSSKSIEENEQPKIIKTENVFAKPMSLEEAVLQLKLLKNDFLVFINASTAKINVIYHRKDGDYGLIEPEV